MTFITDSVWLCGCLVVCHTVQIDRGVVERRRRVVVQEAVLPDGPGLGVGQFRDRSVQQGDRGTGLVMFGHPLYRRLYPVSPGVSQTHACRSLRGTRQYFLPGCLVNLQKIDGVPLRK